jgi:predicted TIM-barrel fold metal-dependent hydrolase
VVWGSDRPVFTTNPGSTLTDWVNAVKVIVAGASADEQERLFALNAERIYRV